MASGLDSRRGCVCKVSFLTLLSTVLVKHTVQSENLETQAQASAKSGEGIEIDL